MGPSTAARTAASEARRSMSGVWSSLLAAESQISSLTWLAHLGAQGVGHALIPGSHGLAGPAHERHDGRRRLAQVQQHGSGSVPDVLQPGIAQTSEGLRHRSSGPMMVQVAC